MKTSYCVMGTSVRTGKRAEITNNDSFMTKEEANDVLIVLTNAFLEIKNEYSFKDLSVEKRIVSNELKRKLEIENKLKEYYEPMDYEIHESEYLFSSSIHTVDFTKDDFNLKLRFYSPEHKGEKGRIFYFDYEKQL